MTYINGQCGIQNPYAKSASSCAKGQCSPQACKTGQCGTNTQAGAAGQQDPIQLITTIIKALLEQTGGQAPQNS